MIARAASPSEWRGPARAVHDPGRFQLLRIIGAGGMGTVYEAIDRRRGARVALKTLRAPVPEDLLHLKNEFRALQDVQHPNLLTLGELVEEDGRWFLTMELVDGVDFLAWARPGAVDALASTGLSDTGPAGATTLGPSPLPAGGFVDVARLRDALRQLAEALCALHDAGKVHRDVKPANVLVTSAGRVVLLDFGLAAELSERAPGDPYVVGTLAYMAPEQLFGRRVGPAADWYSAGVVLYLALTGLLPLRGHDLARKKASSEPLPVRQLCPEAPADLGALCDELLRLDPAARPSGCEVLRRLGVTPRSAPLPARFIGRARELTALQAAVDESRSGAVTALVVGESGMGKSALMRELAATRSHALVLQGRCYERESVPFKAFDGIVDALAGWLARRDADEVARLLPDDAAALARLFPVLRRVPALAELAAPALRPQELRAHAFAALRELCDRLARAYTLVLLIDDLHWADADSLRLLADLMHPPFAPPLCLVATLRPSQAVAAACSELAGVQRILVGPLLDGDARRLAGELLGPGEAALAGAISDEAAGHPLFLQELARHVRGAGLGSVARVPLDDALWARIAQLAPPARQLLEVLAVAGAPLSAAVAAGAAELAEETTLASAAELRVAHLARTVGARVGLELEPYHDRVRQALLARLGAERRRDCHRRLAGAMEAEGRAALDPERLVRHLEAAGENARAAAEAERAAVHATAALAFDQAAELYRTALRLGEPDAATARRLRVALAEALTNAGRGADAAAIYLACVDGADAAERLEYRRRAAEHLLRSGHLDRGLAVLDDVLADFGERLPSTQRRALGALLWRRLRLGVRGLQSRAPSTDARVLGRLDVYHSVGCSLGLIDNVRAAAVQASSLLVALDAGEPTRLARSYLMEAFFRGSQDERGQQIARRLLARAGAIAEARGDHYLQASHGLAEAFLDYHAGAFSSAGRRFAEAEARFADPALRGVYFEQGFARCFRLFALRHRGCFAELQRDLHDALRDAARRGDKFTEASLRLNLNAVWLAEDRPDEAQRQLDEVRWTPPRQGVHMQHWYELSARCEIDLYRGDVERGLMRLRAFVGAAGRSSLFRVRLARAGAHWLHARLLLAGAHDHAARTETARLARRLAREAAPYATVWSLLLAGALAPDRVTAEARLGEAWVEAERHELPLCAHAARWRLGEKRGGAAGAQLIADARARLHADGVRDPERMVASVAPGYRARL